MRLWKCAYALVKPRLFAINNAPIRKTSLKCILNVKCIMGFLLQPKYTFVFYNQKRRYILGFEICTLDKYYHHTYTFGLVSKRMANEEENKERKFIQEEDWETTFRHPKVDQEWYVRDLTQLRMYGFLAYDFAMTIRISTNRCTEVGMVIEASNHRHPSFIVRSCPRDYSKFISRRLPYVQLCSFQLPLNTANIVNELRWVQYCRSRIWTLLATCASALVLSRALALAPSFAFAIDSPFRLRSSSRISHFT